MAFRGIVFACVQVLCLQSAYSSCIPNACTETCVQTPVLLNQPSIVAQPTIISQPCLAPCEIEYVRQYAVPALPAVPAAATFIQERSVANDLINAMQLLIVSNLMTNTLPNTGALNLVQPALPIAQPSLQIAQPALQIAPPALQYVSGCGCGCGCGCGGCGGINLLF